MAPSPPPPFLAGHRYADAITILLISLITALLCELISYLLIYRTSSYSSLKSSIDRSSKKLQTLKSQTLKSKKTNRIETNLKDASRDLSMFKFKSGFVVAVVLFVVFGLLSSLFEGKVVGKLPFVPVRIVAKMSHRGLGGYDLTDCSMAFLYLLCSVSIRTNLQKFLGFSPPRGAVGGGLFPLPDQKIN